MSSLHRDDDSGQGPGMQNLQVWETVARAHCEAHGTLAAVCVVFCLVSKVSKAVEESHRKGSSDLQLPQQQQTSSSSSNGGQAKVEGGATVKPHLVPSSAQETSNQPTGPGTPAFGASLTGVPRKVSRASDQARGHGQGQSRLRAPGSDVEGRLSSPDGVGNPHSTFSVFGEPQFPYQLFDRNRLTGSPLTDHWESDQTHPSQ
ncbi:hypothetical protein CC2G_009444 [Coprinopsis cinerea AmutBmut pab1-1]|nr:hypothetical protein CC2G_009444 [Coprinopsis cinerea AmutBmut pab1-1]